MPIISSDWPAFGKVVRGLISLPLIFSFVVPAPLYAQSAGSVLNLPAPTAMLSTTDGFAPLVIKGMNIHADNPFRFDFITDTGDTRLEGEAFNNEAKRVIKYFLAALTVPEDQMWVNLSPYEKDRIIPKVFGDTEMGRDLLAQDYLLKQLMSSLMFPDGATGGEFWKRVYARAQERFGTTDIPINTFNKIWIVPAEASIYEHKKGVFIVDSHFKVMLDEDYLAVSKNKPDEPGSADAQRQEIISGVSLAVVREVLIPEIEKEVNEGKTFEELRQIYHSMLLATWYKRTLKESVFGRVYVDQAKTRGVDNEDKSINQRIYDRYLEAFKKGIYNYIKEEVDPVSQVVVPRKYFSGGLNCVRKAFRPETDLAIVGSEAGRIARRTKIVTWDATTVSQGSDSAARVDLVQDILKEGHLQLVHIDRNGRQISLGEKFQEIQKSYEEALAGFATASVDRQTGKITDDETVIRKNQRDAELKRMVVVREMYDIGQDALAITNSSRGRDQVYARNYVVALLALKKVMEMQTLMKHRYSETVRGSEYALANDVFPNFMSNAEALREGMGAEYLSTLELIKDVRQAYADAYQRHLNVIQQKSTIGAIAVENIVYDLGLSDEELFWGINADQGRSAALLNEMALALRALLFYEGPEVSYAKKAQAAAFLEVLFNKYMYQAKAARSVDQNGGLTISADVYEAVLTGTRLKEAEQKAFGTFLFSGRFDTLKGHSLTAMSWLARIYHAMSVQYYFKSVSESVGKQIEASRPELMAMRKSLESVSGQGKPEELDEMLRIFQAQFPRKQVTANGVVTQLPVRLELNAGGIQDSTFLSTSRPEGYKVINLAAELTREDGTVGRNCSVSFEVVDLKAMPKAGAKQALVRIESLDLGFNVLITRAGEIIQKSKASLVLDALVSMGLFPKAIMKRAVQDGREEEVLRTVLEHVFGKDKGLVINLHVRDITAGSGLAVSSMLAMGVVTTFDVLMGKPADGQGNEIVNRLQIPVDGVGDYQVEVSADKDFRDGSVRYSFTAQTQAADKPIDVDLVAGELSGAGVYYVRWRKITQAHPVSEKGSGDEWSVTGEVNIQASDTVPEEPVGKGMVRRFSREYLLMNGNKSVERAISTSQDVVLGFSGMAGTQDETAQSGGVRFLTSKGAVVPELNEVPLSPKARANLQKGVRILRIGLTEAAEDTLAQVFANSILNSARDQISAWGQISVQMLNALVLGDTVELGRLANAAVPLREQMAPVSVNAIVIRALEKMKKKYGAAFAAGGAGFSYGITGARSTGSVLLFFDPRLEESTILDIVNETAREVRASIAGTGKMSPVEEDPHAFLQWRISTEGTRVLLLGAEEMQRYNQNVIAPQREREQALREVNQNKRVVHSPEEVIAIEAQQHIDPRTEFADMRGDTLSTLSDELRVLVSPEAVISGQIGRAEIQRLAAQVFDSEYSRFTAPGVNPELRKLVSERVQANLGLVLEAGLSSGDSYVLYSAIAGGVIDLLWDWKNAAAVSQMIRQLQQGRPATELAQGYSAELKAFQQRLTGIETLHARDIDDGKVRGSGFMGPEFKRQWRAEIELVNRKIASLKRSLTENVLETADDWNRLDDQRNELVEQELLLGMLQLSPDPEYLPYGHFLFEMSTTYFNLFGRNMRHLEEAANEGALVYVVPMGGRGGRMYGGNTVKYVAPFHVGHEANATYLKLLVRRWAGFLGQFPDRREGFIHLAMSAFTADAINTALGDAVKEAGVRRENVASTEQGLRRPTWLTEAEFLLELALKATATDAERTELMRKYQWRIREAGDALLRANTGRSQGDEYSRAPFDRPGLNPLNVYSANGTAGSLQTMLMESSDIYTERHLVEAGYALDPTVLQQMRASADGARELQDGMPLAKAALLVQGKGLSVGIIQNASSRANIGGSDIAVGDAVNEIWSKGTMAVAQYANVAGGGDQGGVLAMTREGQVTTIEADRARFLDRHLLVQDHVSMATGTVIVNLKMLWRFLGYGTGEEYLKATAVDIRNRMDQYMSDAGWGNAVVTERREEALPGQKYEWSVAQTETVLQWALTWAQRQYGLEAVKYQEVKARVAYIDDKTTGDLNTRLARAQQYETTSVTTALPPGEVEDPEVAVEDKLAWAGFYGERKMWGHAAELIAQARGTLMQAQEGALKGQQKREYEGQLNSLEQQLAELQRQQPPARPQVRAYGQRLTELSAQQRMQGFNVSDKVAGPGRVAMEERLEELRVLILEVERLMLDVTPDLGKLIKNEFGGRIPTPLLGGIISQILVGLKVEDVLQKYGIGKEELHPEWLLAMQRTLRKAKNNTPKVDALNNAVRLAYFRYEFTALFDQIAEALMLQDQHVKGKRLSEHKVTLLVDKDATIEVPGRVLKQVSMVEGRVLKPSRALEIINAAILGAEVNILTGSTALEGWGHVLEQISRVLFNMKIPRSMKRMAIQRIRLLANDGTALMQMELGDDHRISLRPIIANVRYEDGQWVAASSIIKKKGVTEDKVNRILVWEASVKAYLRQLFLEETPLTLAGAGEDADVRGREKREIQEFITGLHLVPEDLPDMLTPQAAEKLLTFQVSVVQVFAMMLKNVRQEAVTPEAWRWKERFSLVMASKPAAERKLFSANNHEPLTSEEQLYAAILLVNLKESSGTYASLSGDPLDEQRQHDDRVSGLQDLVLNRAFWSGTNAHFETFLRHAREQGGFQDQQANPISFTSRAGPGYLNISFGGVSKKNFLKGMLEDARTHGHIVVITGDSITDQGEFPFMGRVKIASASREQYRADIKAFQQQHPGRFGSDRFSVEEDKKTGEAFLVFDGVMTHRRWVQARTQMHANLHPALDQIYEQSRRIHQDRITLRILLGTLFEANDLQIERFMEAGLVRTQHMAATSDPFSDGFTKERWGPVGFYPVIRAVMSVAAKGWVLPAEDKTYLELQNRDRVLRGVIEALNQEHVKDFRVVVPETMKTVDGGQIVSPADALGGIDLDPAMVNMNIQREGQGFAVPLQQSVGNMNADGFVPVIVKTVSGDQLLSFIGLVK
ncbi:MAG: hypothetical protein HQL20_06225 [Candidatus Omnitrophica bacterium]|nr:hypothetical protein [Candidatus Omnitrophota bacterium]